MKNNKKSKAKNKVKKNAPLGIKVISIVGYIFAALFILTGVFCFILGIIYTINPGSIDLKELFPEQFINQLNDNFSANMIMLGIIFAIIAVILYWICRELLNRKNWARIFIIVFSILSIFSDIGNLIAKKEALSSYIVITFIINILIIFYLLTDKEVKKFFN